MTTVTLIKPRIADGVRDRVSARIAAERGVTEAEAHGNFDKMVEWLTSAAVTPGQHRPPFDAVDVAWHTFILHTLDYAQFCQDNFGRFIHHVPDEGVTGANADCSVTNCSSTPGPGR